MNHVWAPEPEAWCSGKGRGPPTLPGQTKHSPRRGPWGWGSEEAPGTELGQKGRGHRSLTATRQLCHQHTGRPSALPGCSPPTKRNQQHTRNNTQMQHLWQAGVRWVGRESRVCSETATWRRSKAWPGGKVQPHHAILRQPGAMCWLSCVSRGGEGLHELAGPGTWPRQDQVPSGSQQITPCSPRCTGQPEPGAGVQRQLSFSFTELPPLLPRRLTSRPPPPPPARDLPQQRNEKDF